MRHANWLRMLTTNTSRNQICSGLELSWLTEKDCQSRPLRDRDFLLDLTIKVGLYNNEAANMFLEKSMCYTAVSSLLLYDHVVALENKVIR